MKYSTDITVRQPGEFVEHSWRDKNLVMYILARSVWMFTIIVSRVLVEHIKLWSKGLCVLPRVYGVTQQRGNRNLVCQHTKKFHSQLFNNQHSTLEPSHTMTTNSTIVCVCMCVHLIQIDAKYKTHLRPYLILVLQLESICSISYIDHMT